MIRPRAIESHARPLKVVANVALDTFTKQVFFTGDTYISLLNPVRALGYRLLKPTRSMTAFHSVPEEA